MEKEEKDKLRNAIDILSNLAYENHSDRNAKTKPAKYVWMIVGGANPCDIRRYAFTHQQAVSQLAHAKNNKYKDCFYTHGKWELFKLVRVNKRQSRESR